MRFLLTLLSALLLSGSVFAQDPSVEKTTVAKAGADLPQFKVEMLDGTKIESADLAGSVVLINFWATWCPPCRKELTRVQADIVDRFAGKKFVFLPISRGESRETVRAFMEKAGYTFPVGLDPDTSIYPLFATNYVPRNFVVDASGKIVLATAGYESDEFDEMIKVIEKLL